MLVNITRLSHARRARQPKRGRARQRAHIVAAVIMLASSVAHTAPVQAQAIRAPAVASRRNTRVIRADVITDSIMQREMRERRIPGAVVVVMRDGVVLKESAYGVANLATGERVTPATGFFIASITKAATTAAIFRLIDAGRLRLDESVGARLPELPLAWRVVTVRQLLDGTSALPEIAQDYDNGLYYAEYSMALDSTRARPMGGAPGTAEGALTTNYVLLGRLIEVASGQSYADAVQRRVLAPLGITTAAIGDWRIIGPGRAEWYSTLRTDPRRDFDGERTLLRTNYPSYFQPNAGLFTTGRDPATLADALLTGRLLRASSCAQYWQARVLPVASTDYAPMWGSWDRVADGRVKGNAYEHSGGVRTAVIAGPDSRLVVVVLTNLLGALPQLWIHRIYNAFDSAPAGASKSAIGHWCAPKRRKSSGDAHVPLSGHPLNGLNTKSGHRIEVCRVAARSTGRQPRA